MDMNNEETNRLCTNRLANSCFGPNSFSSNRVVSEHFRAKNIWVLIGLFGRDCLGTNLSSHRFGINSLS